MRIAHNLPALAMISCMLAAPACMAAPPVDIFFKPIAYPQMIISPHGRHVAVLYPNHGAGEPVEFFDRPDEGHGFFKEANNIELFTKIETFLQKCDPAN